MPEALAYGLGWINGGDRFEVHRPLRLGDEVTSQLTFTGRRGEEGPQRHPGAAHLRDRVPAAGRDAGRPPRRDAGAAMTGIDARAEELVREETATLRTLVQYAGASGDFYEMHYDIPFAQERGHRELAVHGLLKTAWLGRLVEEWFAGRGRIAVARRQLPGHGLPRRAGDLRRPGHRPGRRPRRPRGLDGERGRRRGRPSEPPRSS